MTVYLGKLIYCCVFASRVLERSHTRPMWILVFDLEREFEICRYIERARRQSIMDIVPMAIQSNIN